MSTVLIKRSSSTAVIPGVTTITYGQLVETNISGITRLYIGNSSNIAVEIAGAAYALLDSPSFTGTPTAPTPAATDNSTNIATTAYVTTAVLNGLEGLTPKAAVTVVTTSTLPAYTYNNGSSGVGATLTATAMGAFPTIDGITPSQIVNVLVNAETGANAPYNGIYTLTNAGSVSDYWVLTRRNDFDSSTTIVANSFTFVEEGSINGSTGWVLTTIPPVTVGTTNISFTQFSSAGLILAGNGLTKSGNTISALSDSTGGTNLAKSINVSSNGLAVKIDSSTINTNSSNQLEVANGGITQTQINSSSLSSSGGLTGGSGTQLAIKPDNITGATIAPVTLSGNGAGIAVDNSSILQSAGTIFVGTVDGGTF